MKPQTQMKLAAVIVFHCLTMTMLFAQAPSTPTQPDNSATQFPVTGAYVNICLTYKIIEAPNST